MAEKGQKFKLEVWNYFQLTELGDKTKCTFCSTLLSYKGTTTKSMWDHVRSKHSFQMTEGKPSAKPVLKQPLLSFHGKHFSEEKQEICYKAATEVSASVFTVS